MIKHMVELETLSRQSDGKGRLRIHHFMPELATKLPDKQDLPAPVQTFNDFQQVLRF